MRTCSSCNTEYEDYGQRSSLCRECKRAYDREFHAKRSPEVKARKAELQKIRKAEIKVWYKEWKTSQSCKVCGEDEEACLDFHHLDPSTKEDAVANLIGKAHSIEKIKKEIAKCVVLCANCHRKLHAGVISV